MTNIKKTKELKSSEILISNIRQIYRDANIFIQGNVF